MLLPETIIGYVVAHFSRQRGDILQCVCVCVCVIILGVLVEVQPDLLFFVPLHHFCMTCRYFFSSLSLTSNQINSAFLPRFFLLFILDLFVLFFCR